MEYQYLDFTGEKDDLRFLFNMYRLTPAPPRRSHDYYIKQYKETGEQKYLQFFLHQYEPELNRRTQARCMEYNLRNKFFDMKQTAVVTIIERLEEFNPESGVPFLKYAGIYIDYAIDKFVLQNGGVFNERINHYKLMKKLNAIYYRLRDEQFPYEERLELCRKEANLKDKDRVIQLL